MAKPLEGVVILDLTRVLAGPYATMLLYDLGATVIKVENPKGGDDARAFPPVHGGESLYFASFNRGKKSISLNLKTDEGKQIVKNLVAKGKVDVITENFRPGTMERLGLGYDELKALNPKIIYAATSGFGHTGPDSALPAYDILAQARGGIMSMTGTPNCAPTRIGASYGDMTAGVFTALGIVSALYQRQKEGIGQKVDIAMLDCQVSMLENALVRYQADGEIPAPLGSAHPSLIPFQAFKASDKHFVIGIANDSLWQKMEAALGLTPDPRFAEIEGRKKHKDELIKLLSDLFITNTAAHWLDIITKAGVPCSLISDIKDVMSDTQLIARNMFVPMADSGIKLAGNPIKSSTLPEPEAFPKAPTIGQDNEQILSDLLGKSQKEISTLKDKGVL